MKKRSIWVVLGLLMAALVFALAGCGGGKKDDNGDGTEYTLSATQITLTVGETKALTISPAPTGTVTWTSANPSVATVSAGTVTAVAAGTTTVTAAIEGVESPLSCNVTVNEQQGGGGTSVYKLNFASLALKTGDTKQLTLLDENDAEVTGAAYTSANPAVATVSAEGLVTAVAAGDTTITATAEGGSATCTVTVTQKYTYSLTPASLDIAAGATQTLTLVTEPEQTGPARPHTFTSSAPEIATVDGGSGEVRGIAKGTATITCAVDGEEVTATVTVTEYTVKIGNEEMGSEIALRMGEADQQITVTADPDTHAVDATYATENDQIVTVTGGLLHAVGVGTTNITVTVGGRVYTASVTVSAAVQYSLKAGGEAIEDDTITLYLGGTKQLTVVRDPEGVIPATTYNSQEATVAQVSSEGLITAKGLGTTTITVAVGEDATFTITVNVVLESTLTHTDFERWTGSVNLQYLDANKTIDWDKYASDGQTKKARMANNTDLIGNYSMIDCDDEAFWDYKVPIFFENAAEGGGVNTYGRAVHGSFSVNVKLTSAVSKVIIFTGAWKASGAIKFKLGDVVLQSDDLIGSDPAVARMYTLAVTTDDIQGDLDLTILLDCTNQNGGNFSIAAVAVIGKEAHNINYTAEATGSVTRELEGEQNITAAGNLDWVAANGTRKAGVPANTFIKGIQYDQNENSGDDFGKNENKNAHITWTDGTAAAPENCKDFKWAANSVTATVALTKGNFTVSLYVTGWNCGYLVAVYDKNGNFLNAYQGADEWEQNSHTAKIAITLDVKEAGDYTFKLTKCRGTGNHGWAAIAVSQNSEYSLEKNTFDLTKDGTTGQKIVVKKGDENYTTGVSFKSNDSQIVGVDSSDGTLTANGKGTTTVTVTIGEEEFLVFVTVTEYTLKSEANITLSKEQTSQIEITAEPNRTVTATYAVTAGDDFVEVDNFGVIKAKAKGEATVTATVDGKVFTITVNVVEYKLDQTEITLTLGGEPATATLKMTEGDEGSDVSGVEFTSKDDQIASVVKETGVITAKGIGKTTIEAKKDGTVLECTVIVKINVETSGTKDYSNTEATVNLDEIDDTNVTLDWRYFGRDGFTEEKKDGDLISEVTGNKASDFYDYKAKINWLNGTVVEQGYLNRVDGITYKEAASFTVKLTKDAKYISVFAGAWHAKITVSLAYDGVEFAKQEFTNTGDGNEKNKQLVFAPDMEHFGETEKTFTVTITPTLDGDGDANASLVAIAVIGNTPRGQRAAAAGSATETHSALTPETDNTINLSEVGTLDWAYINNNGNNGMARKNGGTAIGAFMGTGRSSPTGNDGFGTKHQFFTWTDSAQEPDGGDGDHTKTNKIKWWDGSAISIAVKLEKSATVTLYLSAWQPTCTLDVYDAHGNKLIDNATVLECGGGDGASKIEVKVTVTEASNFTFVINKTPQGNFALGAIAVANVTE